MKDDKQRKAILIDLIHPRMNKAQSMDRMGELEELVNTYGGIVVIKKYQRRTSPHPRTFIGTGKIEEIAEEGPEAGIDLMIINDILKPRQTFEIGEQLREAGIQVWDRVDLILKIFAKHAQTTEARLEIELASIRHMGPRIFGMGMELSRQGGGIGTSGIGETNTEIMRRHLKGKEQKIKKKLEKYQKVRDNHRKGRRRKGLKTVSIVGYTNAGKTTLLNRLTGREEYVADELFATLDTRVGSLWMPGRQEQVLVSDTIGFIKELPPELIKAFASTLSEAVDADFLLHVVDASDTHVFEHIAVVEDILRKLKVGDKPVLLVCNKIDKASEEAKVRIKERLEEMPHVWISAHSGEGIDALIEEIEGRV
jgi:GTPase